MSQSLSVSRDLPSHPEPHLGSYRPPPTSRSIFPGPRPAEQEAGGSPEDGGAGGHHKAPTAEAQVCSSEGPWTALSTVRVSQNISQWTERLGLFKVMLRFP